MRAKLLPWTCGMDYINRSQSGQFTYKKRSYIGNGSAKFLIQFQSYSKMWKSSRNKNIKVVSYINIYCLWIFTYETYQHRRLLQCPLLFILLGLNCICYLFFAVCKIKTRHWQKWWYGHNSCSNDKCVHKYIEMWVVVTAMVITISY